MQRHSVMLLSAVAVIVAMVVFFVVIWREPDPVAQGTAPSVVQGRTDSGAPAVPQYPDGREVDSSAAAARGARGSGVEGVPSGGVTLDPPNGR